MSELLPYGHGAVLQMETEQRRLHDQVVVRLFWHAHMESRAKQPWSIILDKAMDQLTQWNNRTESHPPSNGTEKENQDELLACPGIHTKQP